MKTIHAIYENGMFRPTEPVELPENSRVEFELRLVPSDDDSADQAGIWEIVNKRYNSGQHDTAERHNEHQP